MYIGEKRSAMSAFADNMSFQSACKCDRNVISKILRASCSWTGCSICRYLGTSPCAQLRSTDYVVQLFDVSRLRWEQQYPSNVGLESRAWL